MGLPASRVAPSVDCRPNDGAYHARHVDRRAVHGALFAALRRVGRQDVILAPEKTGVARALLPKPVMCARRRRRASSEAGIAMAIALFTLLVFMLLTATSTLIGSADTRAT